MELQELLQRIDALQAEINALRPLSPDLEGRIMQKFRLDWNFHSSNIEGNSLTFGETKTFLLHGLTAEGKPLRDHLEIKGHNEALHALEDIVNGNRPLTEHAIKSFHQIILGEPYQIPARTDEGAPAQRWVTPGKYKSQPNHVRTVTGETFYFASPENTPHEMEQLMEWYNEALADEHLHPLVTAAVFHYKFIRIHPFDDGNGRIARILMNLVLMMRRYPPVIIHTEDKENYYRALRQADGDDINAFVVYVGEQLLRSQEIYLKGARGEEFEEMDDIDKKIALFKARINLGDNALQKRRSRESVKDVIDNSIVPLLNTIFEKLSQFDDLFLDKTFDVELFDEYGPRVDELGGDFDYSTVENRTRIFNVPESKIAWLLQRDKVYNDIATVIVVNKWQGFRKPKQRPFDLDAKIVLNFSEYKYTIFCYDIESSRRYHEMISDEEAKVIAAGTAEIVLEQLQLRISEEE